MLTRSYASAAPNGFGFSYSRIEVVRFRAAHISLSCVSHLCCWIKCLMFVDCLVLQQVFTCELLSDEASPSVISFFDGYCTFRCGGCVTKLTDSCHASAVGGEVLRYCFAWWLHTNLVDPASSHMLVSKIKPCMSQYKLLHGKTANGSLKQ